MAQIAEFNKPYYLIIYYCTMYIHCMAYSVWPTVYVCDVHMLLSSINL